MAYEPKDNSGTLFKNDRREKETHPHAKGSALIDGVEYWVSAWTKEGAKGRFQSLAFTRKENSGQQQAQPPQRQQSYAEQSGGSYGSQPDDLAEQEIPF